MSNEYPVWCDDETALSRQVLVSQALAARAELDQARALIQELSDRCDRLTGELAQAKIEAAAANQQYERVRGWLKRAQRQCAAVTEAAAGINAILVEGRR